MSRFDKFSNKSKTKKSFRDAVFRVINDRNGVRGRVQYFSGNIMRIIFHASSVGSKSGQVSRELEKYERKLRKLRRIGR